VICSFLFLFFSTYTHPPSVRLTRAGIWRLGESTSLGFRLQVLCLEVKSTDSIVMLPEK
jgi:hypothetical protein